MDAVESRPIRTAVRDILDQAWRAVIGRKNRSILTAAGVALGIAATVATLEVTTTAAGAISDKFDATEATSVTLRWPDGAARPQPSVVANVTRLNGVESAGLMCQANQGQHSATSVMPAIATGTPLQVNLIAAQASALTAAKADLVRGRFFDDGNGKRGEPVAVLDTVAAKDLGITHAGQLIYLDGKPLSVLGVYRAPTGEARMTEAVVVPYEQCLRDSTTTPLFAQPEAVVRTALGAADQVAGEAGLALRPDYPGSLGAVVPPDLRTFRKGVEADTRSLFLGLALVSLIIGALGVSNTTLVSVLERRSEIGLRRAIGAGRLAVAAQFLIESGVLGLAGGLLGTIVAIDITTCVALIKGWLVVLEPAVLGAAPLLGVLVGTLAGAYPAWKASRVMPAASLRSS